MKKKFLLGLGILSISSIVSFSVSCGTESKPTTPDKSIPDTGSLILNGIINKSLLTKDGNKKTNINDKEYSLQNKDQWKGSLSTIATLVKDVNEVTRTNPAPIGITDGTNPSPTIENATKIGIDANALSDALSSNNLAIADIVFHKINSSLPGANWIQSSFLTSATSLNQLKKTLNNESSIKEMIKSLLNIDDSKLINYGNPEIMFYDASGLEKKSAQQTSTNGHMIVEFELVDRKVNSKLSLISRVSFLATNINIKGGAINSIETESLPAIYHTPI
ncbi:MAG: hypothetical protein NC236_02410 [Mycoplasma sp.]|nr:hypothetical protein [Mycoplasma sp.]